MNKYQSCTLPEKIASIYAPGFLLAPTVTGNFTIISADPRGQTGGTAGRDEGTFARASSASSFVGLQDGACKIALGRSSGVVGTGCCQRG